MKRAASRIGVLCVAAGLLAGCETVGDMASATTDTVGGWYSSAKNTVMGSDRNYIAKQVGDGLDEDDAVSISRKSAMALEKTPAGKTVTWQNPDSGASATITPGETIIEKRKIKAARMRGVERSSSLVLIGRTYKAVRNANVRAAPGTGKKIVGGLAKGEKITAIGKVERSDWIMVGMDGRAIGYVYAPLLQPATKQTPRLREAGDDDMLADVEDSDGVVVETMTVSTACRNVSYTVKMADGESAEDEFRACKASDGAWEIN